jgi:uncharacterized protein DUF4153
LRPPYSAIHKRTLGDIVTYYARDRDSLACLVGTVTIHPLSAVHDFMADVSTGLLSPDGRWRWDGTAWRSTAAPSDPLSMPVWASIKLRADATWPMLGAALAVGLISDQALRAGTFGLAASATVALLPLILIFGGLSRSPSSRLLAAGGLAFAAWLTVRSSPWLLWPDLGAALILLGLSASFAFGGSLADVGVAEAIARSVHAVANGLAGSPFIVKPLGRSRARMSLAAPIARGLLIAAPIAVLVALLLAAADPIFASFFNVNVDFGQLSIDVVFVLAGSLFAAGLPRLASAEPLGRIDGPSWRLGATEGLIVLAVLDAIFAAFAVAQALGVTGAAADTLRAAGVTYADYARSGFFELLWVAGITAVVIIVFSRITSLRTPRTRRSFMVLAEVGISLTLLIVFVAFRRLSFYEDAFGFTMLRLYSHIFAVWIAIVFVFLAADIAGLYRRRRWFVGATVASATVVLLLLNVANPEALIVTLNIEHATTTHKIDADYLGQLSNDAIPTLLASRSQLDPSLRSQIARVACAGSRTYSAQVAAYNLADAGAAAARRAGC